MSNNIIKKIFFVVLIFAISVITIFFSNVKAVNLNAADIFSAGDCGSLLMYNGIVIKADYAQYIYNGVSYPAYCLDKNKKGVDSNLSYTVSIEDTIKDVGLWKYIINGYPYKTIEELGCHTKEEAFTATKQAIYCYIHGNNPDKYEAIGEAGKRTLNALHKIISDVQSCTEVQVSNKLNIKSVTEKFEVDNKDRNYMSRTYSVSAGAKIKDYKISISGKNIENIKITDLNNKEKTEFSPNENFKILIPIKDLTQNVKFSMKVEAKIKNKPVLYGKSADSSHQDYALTAATYDDAEGKKDDECSENKTKLKVIKQNAATKERLKDVEFRIFDENKNIIFANLKTNSNGEFELKYLLPGKYYIQEVNTNDGYIINNDILEFDLEYNQEMTITIDNSVEERSEEKNSTKEINSTVTHEKIPEVKEEVSEKTIFVKKLPVTGM